MGGGCLSFHLFKTITKHHRIEFASHSLGSWKSKVKAPIDSMSSEVWFQDRASQLHLVIAEREVSTAYLGEERRGAGDELAPQSHLLRMLPPSMRKTSYDLVNPNAVALGVKVQQGVWKRSRHLNHSTPFRSSDT